MSNTADHVGRPQTVEALGQTWTLGRWERRVWAAFLEWAKDKIPNPKTEAAEMLKLIPLSDTETRTALVKQALADAQEYLSETSPRVQNALDSLAGATQLVYLLLKDNHPEATEDTAHSIVMTVGQERMIEVLKRCAGVPPQKKENPGESPTMDSPSNGLLGRQSIVV